MLAYLDVPVMAQPEVYVYFDPDDLIDMEGEVGVAATREFLAEVMRAFEEWIVTVKAGQASVEKGETAETV